MKYFVIEGTLTTSEPMDDSLMQNHIGYTQKAINQGQILLTGLKGDMSGGLFIMKAESSEQVHSYLASEPFQKEGLQTYEVTEFSPHYFNNSPADWFEE